MLQADDIVRYTCWSSYKDSGLREAGSYMTFQPPITLSGNNLDDRKNPPYPPTTTNSTQWCVVLPILL